MADNGKSWRIVGSRESLTSNVDDGTLALHMGIAANAIGAAQRFYWFVRDAPGPGGQRDRLWAFLIAIGFIHEALQTVLRPQFPRIRDLALAAGASQESIDAAGQLLSGKHPLSKTIDRMRNKLIFHWDEDVVRKYVCEFSENTVPWAEGVGNSQGESVFAAAANALTNSVFPDEPNATEDRNLERIRDLIKETSPTMQLIVKLFNHAIMGHLKGHATELEQ